MKCQSGEIGRHSRLKICRYYCSVGVQIPSLALLSFFCSCGGIIEVEQNKDMFIIDSLIVKDTLSKLKKDTCNNFKCEENAGETYWNCLDCVDLYTGGPINGYCGDGICFNESIFYCWKDCRPKAFNPYPERPGPYDR